jgi:hypothetical protein
MYNSLAIIVCTWPSFPQPFPLGVVPSSTKNKPSRVLPLYEETGSDCEGVPGALEEEYEKGERGKEGKSTKSTRILTVFSSE